MLPVNHSLVCFSFLAKEELTITLKLCVFDVCVCVFCFMFV